MRTPLTAISGNAGYLLTCYDKLDGQMRTQIFTDIYGAGRLGMERILVKPICPREEIQIVLKRIPERLVLWLYRRYSRRAEAGRRGGENRRERRICRGGKK